MIKSFSCRDTEKLANNYRVRRFVAFERIAQRKLMQLKAAETLDMLGTPPGNRLEALKSDRKGQYSIRINGQWGFVFDLKMVMLKILKLWITIRRLL